MAFGRRCGSDPDAARQAESLRAIEAGGIPLSARERLGQLRAGQGGSYTSDLSTAEFLLLRQAGFTPVAQVMGSAFYRMGWQNMPGKRAPGAFAPEGQATPGSAHASGFEYDTFGRRVYANAAFGQVFELDIETEAWQEARRLALGRLSQEAALAGADAVVGVHLRRGRRDWGRSLIEFVVSGTAVASDRYDLGPEPVLSNLSGQDFAKLYASGWWPVGLVAATSVVYVMTGWQQGQAAKRLAANQELADYTEGVQHARKLAVSRVERDARSLGAVGLVGLALDVARRVTEHEGSRTRAQKDLIVTAHTLGTAIAMLDRPAETPPVTFTIPLDEVAG